MTTYYIDFDAYAQIDAVDVADAKQKFLEAFASLKSADAETPACPSVALAANKPRAPAVMRSAFLQLDDLRRFRSRR